MEAINGICSIHKFGSFSGTGGKGFHCKSKQKQKVDLHVYICILIFIAPDLECFDGKKIHLAL